MRNRKGFTLLEVLTAIGIIAIISGPLLYMFVTATKVGRHSYDSDKANAIAVQAVEIIKSSPGDRSELSADPITGTPTKTIYFDKDWNTVGDESQAVYRALITLKDNLVGKEYTSYIPTLLDGEETYWILIRHGLNNGTYNLSLTFDEEENEYVLSAEQWMLSTDGGMTYKDTVNIPSGHLTSDIIPILMDIAGNENADYTFKVVNIAPTGADIGFYIYGDAALPHKVKIQALAGEVVENYMTVRFETLDFNKTDINALITRMADGSVIADYTTMIYLPG
jgi:prepilin-type N-terminal cleavage/methylation domain-containing protein